MIILGIDPGYAIVGYGVVECVSANFRLLACGAITTAADMPFHKRLKTIYDDMTQIVRQYSPEEMSIEKLFFNSNEKTAIDVAQARGVRCAASFTVFGNQTRREKGLEDNMSFDIDLNVRAGVEAIRYMILKDKKKC